MSEKNFADNPFAGLDKSRFRDASVASSTIVRHQPGGKRKTGKTSAQPRPGTSGKSGQPGGVGRNGPVGQHPVPDEEQAQFLEAMANVEPLKAGGRAVSPAVEPAEPPVCQETSLQDFMDGKLEFALSFTDEYLEGFVVGLDQMILNRLRAGGFSPEAHLDLHGLNAMQAFEALRGFLRSAWYKGLRNVLVVPGRGRNSPFGMSVLREKLQTWLTQEPFKRVVLAFCTARPHDGGPGSVYVLLRKYKKKGRIYWERMPADSEFYI